MFIGYLSGAMLLWVYMIEENKYNNDVLKLRREYGVGKKVELTNEQKQEKIQQITESISRKEEIIEQTTAGIEKIRESLGMGPSMEIPPSILSEQASLEKIKKEKEELEEMQNIQETNKEVKQEELINEFENDLSREEELPIIAEEVLKQNEQEIPEIIQQQILEKIPEELQNQPEIKEEIKTIVEDLQEQQEQPKEIDENEGELNEAEKHFESVKNEEKLEEIRRFEANLKTSLENISNSGMKILDALNERQEMRLTPLQSEDDFYRMVSLFKSLSNNETKFDVSTLENIKQGFQNLGSTFEEMEFQNRGGISENLDNLERLSYSLRNFAAVCDDVSRKLPIELPDKQVEELVLQLKNTLQVVDQKSNEAWLKVTRRRDILG